MLSIFNNQKQLSCTHIFNGCDYDHIQFLEKLYDLSAEYDLLMHHAKYLCRTKIQNILQKSADLKLKISELLYFNQYSGGRIMSSYFDDINVNIDEEELYNFDDLVCLVQHSIDKLNKMLMEKDLSSFNKKMLVFSALHDINSCLQDIVNKCKVISKLH